MAYAGISVRLEIKTPAVKKILEEIIAGDKNFALQQGGSETKCDLLILEIDGSLQEFEKIRQIADSGIAADLFVTSPNTSSSLLLEALRAGVKEFLPQPLNKKEIIEALSRVKQRQPKGIPAEPTVKGKIIHVLGSKGGVGQTTLAVNLAAGLLELEDVKSVAIWDMNPLTGDVPVFLGVEPTFDWLEIADNMERLDSTFLMSGLCKHSSGIYILPAPVNPFEASKVSRQMLERVSEMMSGLFDFTIIDCGPLLGSTADLLKFSDLILLLVVLNLPGLVSLKRLLAALDIMGYSSPEKLKIVVNRLQKKSLISMADAEKSVNRKFLAGLPNDYQITMSAINQGRPVSGIDADSELSRKFRELAGLISGKSEKKKKPLFGLGWIGSAGVGRKSVLN